MAQGWRNKLYFGDNLPILREHIADESVDLIYLDPPFNSKADYNVLYKNASGESNASQAVAFKDTWEWDRSAAEAFHELMTRPEVPAQLKNLMKSLKVFLTGDISKKGNSMMAYLTMMALRLVELHRVLKPTGSLYLHCDPTASHYIKMIMDAVFGYGGFRNEIVWRRTNAHNYRVRRYDAVHDVLFFYTKDATMYKWNAVYQPYSQAQLARYEEDEKGRLFTGQDLTMRGKNPDRQDEWRGSKPPANRVWANSIEERERLYADGLILLKKDGTPRLDGLKVFLDERPGKRSDDIWDDIGRIGNTSQERLGYPTQKPEALLERILQASSSEGDVVLDPFCGCGTAVAVAERLNRKWIGIDITYLAVDLIERRLLDSFTPGSDVRRLADIPVQKRRLALRKYWESGEDVLQIGLRTGLSPYDVLGDPKSAEDARSLFENDPYQFEWWAIGMVGAQGKERRKGADRGIDGVITFLDKVGEYEHAVVSVKGGKVGSAAIRDLKGTMQKENAVIGILVTNEPPSAAMRKEAADAGRWTSQLHADRSYPVIQILTSEDLLAGHDPDLPRWGLSGFRQASQVKHKVEQKSVFEDDESP